jgi:hypothetical protein
MAPHRAGMAGHRVCDRLTAIPPIRITGGRAVEFR